MKIENLNASTFGPYVYSINRANLFLACFIHITRDNKNSEHGVKSIKEELRPNQHKHESAAQSSELKILISSYKYRLENSESKRK